MKPGSNFKQCCKSTAVFNAPLGGRILPSWPDGPPNWLTDPSLDLIAGVLGHYDLGPESRVIGNSDLLPFGANFTVRRTALEKIGHFDEALGVVDDRRRRGEDTDLLQRAISLGYQGRYVADALCLHRIDPRNLNLSRLFEVGFEKGLSVDRIHRSFKQHFFVQARITIRAFVQLLKGRGDRFRQCVIRLGIEQGNRQERDA